MLGWALLIAVVSFIAGVLLVLFAMVRAFKTFAFWRTVLRSCTSEDREDICSIVWGVRDEIDPVREVVYAPALCVHRYPPGECPTCDRCAP